MKKRFSLIRPEVGRLGNEEFSLSLQRTIPQDADHGWLPAYLFEMVADAVPFGSAATMPFAMSEISATRFGKSFADITMPFVPVGFCWAWHANMA